MFPINDDYLEERQFSDLHKIILNIIPNDLRKALILNGAHVDINAGDSNGMTPLMWAARRGDSGAVKALIENHADLDVCNQFLQSALLNAVRASSLACVKLLLKAGAKTAQKDRLQFGVLHYTVICCNSGELVRYLIAAGAEVNERDCYGATPLFRTTDSDYVSAARALLDNGASLQAFDIEGDSILHQAFSLRAKKVLRLLLKRGAPRTSRNLAGQSILHYAALYADLDCLEILRSANLKGMDPDAEDLKGSTPLQLAHKRGRKPEGFIEKLQELFAEIRARNASDAVDSNTPEPLGGDTSYKYSFFNLGRVDLQALQIRARIRSIVLPRWKSILLYWILGLGWAGFVYKLLERGHTTQLDKHASEPMGLPAEETCAWSYDSEAL